MAELRWPHRATPRRVESIAEKEVLLWEMRQHERRDVDPPRPTGSAGNEPAPDRTERDRLGFHYWSDAIVAELTRVMVSKTDPDAPSDASSGPSSGFVEAPSNFVEHRDVVHARNGVVARGRRHWFHRSRRRKPIV